MYLLISRLFCVSGNNQQHDAHHIEPKRLDFCNSAYDRERLVAEGKDDCWHTWGLFPAIDRTFRVLAALPQGPASQPTKAVRQEALAAAELM